MVEEEEKECTCEFGSVHDLGVVLSHSPSRSGELVVLGFVTLASGAPGPATHGGSRLTPGAQIVGVVTSCGEQEIQLSVAGELCVQGEAPLQLRFRPQPLALVADAAAAPDLTEVSSGRSAARVAKYSSYLRLRLPGQWPQEAAWARAWRCARQARQEAAVVTCRESPDR